MTDQVPPLIAALQRRFELGQAVSQLNARKLSKQQAGFGAEITMLQQQRDIQELGDSPERQAILAEAAKNSSEAKRAVASFDSELAELEAQIEAIDRQIAASQT
jgi:hypothetical protein